MGMKDRSLIDTINLTFIALTAMAIHHCLSAWKTREFRIPPEFRQVGGALPKCDTKYIDHAVNNECPDVICRLDVDFASSSPAIKANTIDNIRSMIR
jgi:hypothetical protein